MKRLTLSLLLLSPFFIARAQAPAQTPEITIDFVSDELKSIINADAKVEVVASGFQFTEGPVWDEAHKMLLFSDVPANTVYKWTEANGKEIYLKPGGYTSPEPRGGFMGPNGMAITKDGKLLICQHGDRRVAMMDAPLTAPEAKYTTVVGEYQGKKLNSPNDLFLTDAGDLYFTDPNYGLVGGANDPSRGTPFQGFYRLDKSGKLTLLTDSIEQPNGVAFFPDGKTVLVSNSDNVKKRWYSYEVAADGSLTNGKIFYDVSNERGAGGPDGFKIDAQGNVFAAGPGGLWIFTKAGKLIGRIKTGRVTAANCALTPDGKTLYITASQYLLRLKMK